MPTQNAPESWFRTGEGLGLWEHRGKVVCVGLGVSPTARRWDERPETSVGAWSILAIRRAMEDAGVSPDQVDGLVMCPDTATGSPWPPGKPIPEAFLKTFKPTDRILDGITGLSAEWILQNTPELTNVKFTTYGSVCASRALVVAAQAVGMGLTHTCLVLKGWHNLAGRYYVGQASAAEDTLSGRFKWAGPWGNVAVGTTAMVFDQYLRKYGKTREMMAPFIVNEKRNGSLFPEGFFYQHRPDELHITVEDYLSARWLAKPASLLDADLPVCVSAAFLFTTPERARDMKQKPVHILNVASNRDTPRSLYPTVEEHQDSSDKTGRIILEGAGVTSSDIDFDGFYDGYPQFHHFHIEGIRFAGINRGEGLDLYQTDISIEGPHPVSPSGGNQGCGRARFWNHLDAVQQLQGRAGARQMRKKLAIGVTGGPMPQGGDYLVWSSVPPD